MQVNLNQSVNQVKPNFKASFANDASTKKVLENFIRNEKETTLATQFALEDIKTNDKISLRYDAKTGDCYAKNMTTTNEILLEDRQLSNPSKLYRAIVEEGFLNERLEGKKNYYLDKAIEFIKKQFSKEQEELNKLNYEYEKLLSDAGYIRQQYMAKDYECFEKQLQFVGEKIFSRIKK